MRYAVQMVLITSFGLSGGACSEPVPNEPVPVCGDGVVQAGEPCDGGAANSDVNADACRTTCRRPACGDGVADSAEACDDGLDNSNFVADACRTSCTAARCGDSVVDTGEHCDPGFTLHCDANCACEIGFGPDAPCLDIDECVADNYACGADTQCTNTEGSFVCVRTLVAGVPFFVPGQGFSSAYQPAGMGSSRNYRCREMGWDRPGGSSARLARRACGPRDWLPDYLARELRWWSIFFPETEKAQLRATVLAAEKPDGLWSIRSSVNFMSCMAGEAVVRAPRRFRV